MTILFIIAIGVAIYFAFRLGADSKQTISRVSVVGGMHVKYAKLLNHILLGHDDCKIICETKTYIRVGVSNYGGTTMFHLQQCPNNQLMIDYEVSDNPAIPNFSLRFMFDDDMDQDLMMIKISQRIQDKLMTLHNNF